MDFKKWFGRQRPVAAAEAPAKRELFNEDGSVSSIKMECTREEMQEAKRIGRRIVDLFEREGISPDRLTMVALAMLLHSNNVAFGEFPSLSKGEIKELEEGAKKIPDAMETKAGDAAKSEPFTPRDVSEIFSATKPGIMTNNDTGEKVVVTPPPKLTQ